MAKTKNYVDCYGHPITEGCTIKYTDSSEEELIYACGDDSLGVNASNLEWLKRHPEYAQEFYPLESNFRFTFNKELNAYQMLEMEVVEK